ncbi:MAG: cob(I)yrinic acid a,c-diamide adenosyltransferase [Patescibacteria group bacterium]|nr:cob(I)yrinic acid a,c-diamide adenosyltransferase [Patescibacteria group bacterium]
MPVYTKKGDRGKTSLFGEEKVLKSDIIIEALGNIDELNSFIGIVVFKIKEKSDKDFLIKIQKDLYQIMSILSKANKKTDFLEKRVFDFEKKIDEIEKKLLPLNKFIVPGGTELSCWFHILRTICRRAERQVVKRKKYFEVVKYLNRLSDLFFMLARFYNKNEDVFLE